MSTMFNLVPAHLGSEKSRKTGQSQGEFLTLLVYFTFVLVYSTFLQDGSEVSITFNSSQVVDQFLPETLI